MDPGIFLKIPVWRNGHYDFCNQFVLNIVFFIDFNKSLEDDDLEIILPTIGWNSVFSLKYRPFCLTYHRGFQSAFNVALLNKMCTSRLYRTLSPRGEKGQCEFFVRMTLYNLKAYPFILRFCLLFVVKIFRWQPLCMCVSFISMVTSWSDLILSTSSF